MEPKRTIIVRKLENPEVLDNKELAYYEQIAETRMTDIDSGSEFVVDRRRQILQGDQAHLIEGLDKQQVQIDKTHQTLSDEITVKREQIGAVDKQAK